MFRNEEKHLAEPSGVYEVCPGVTSYASNQERRRTGLVGVDNKGSQITWTLRSSGHGPVSESKKKERRSPVGTGPRTNSSVRWWHYCHKPGHLAEDCRVKSQMEVALNK